MATNYGKLDFAVAFNRQTAYPLDGNAYFESKATADAAIENAKAAGSSSSQYYYGQLITVYENGTAKVYQIQKQDDNKAVLAEIGGKVDLSSYVKKSSFSSSVVGYLPKIKDADTIEPGYAINSGTTWGGTDSTVATTLAIDNRIKSYYWADVKISATSSTETSPTVKNLSTTTVKIGNAATWQYNSSTDCVELVW